MEDDVTADEILAAALADPETFDVSVDEETGEHRVRLREQDDE